MLLRFLVFATASLVLSAVVAQSPCSTSITFEQVPDAPICSSIEQSQPLVAQPAGGSFAGAIVNTSGFFNLVNATAGDYWIVYTAADSCMTKDSVLIQVLETETELYQDGMFDCASTSSVNLQVFTDPNESIFLNQNNGWQSSVNNNDFQMLTTDFAGSIQFEILSNSGTCVGSFNPLSINEPSVDARVEYPCDMNRAMLAYDGPTPDRVIWRSFEQVPNDIPSWFTFGSSIPANEEGNFYMEATFANGCKSADYVNVPLAFPLVPGVSAGSYAPLACDLSTHDTCRLLGNSGPLPLNYSWSTIDGSLFPGDSTAQTPVVPPVAAQYVLRTINPISMCMSEPDTATITQRQGSSTVIEMQNCQGEAVDFNGLVYVEPGTYTVSFTDRFGCDSTEVLVLENYPDFQLDIRVVSGPNNSQYVVVEPIGQGIYNYFWNQNNETRDSVLVTGDGLYEVQVTNEFGCVRTIGVVIDATSSVQELNRQLRVFPSPTSGVLNWRYSGRESFARGAIYSMTGQHLLALDLKQQVVDLTSLPASLYLLELMTTSGEKVVKRVVKR